MDKLYHALLAIETLAELRLTLCVLAKVSRSGEQCPVITYAEFQSATGFSSATIAKGLTAMGARGYILRSGANRKQAARYQVLWDRFGVPPGGVQPPAIPPRSLPGSIAVSSPAGAEPYFAATGFLDLLPHARDIAHSLGYGEEEIVHAIGLVFDSQRAYPPTINRTRWFTTVFTEKVKAAHAELLAHRISRDRLAGHSMAVQV